MCSLQTVTIVPVRTSGLECTRPAQIHLPTTVNLIVQIPTPVTEPIVANNLLPVTPITVLKTLLLSQIQAITVQLMIDTTQV